MYYIHTIDGIEPVLEVERKFREGEEVWVVDPWGRPARVTNIAHRDVPSGVRVGAGYKVLDEAPDREVMCQTEWQPLASIQDRVDFIAVRTGDASPPAIFDDKPMAEYMHHRPAYGREEPDDLKPLRVYDIWTNKQTGYMLNGVAVRTAGPEPDAPDAPGV